MKMTIRGKSVIKNKGKSVVRINYFINLLLKIIYNLFIFLLLFLAWFLATIFEYIPDYLNIIPNQEFHQESYPTARSRGGWDKPVIYLYPQKLQKVKVLLDYKGKFTASYPVYSDGWDVLAYPDGKLINKYDNKEYNYLFWEGIPDKEIDYDWSKGFVVSGEDTVGFLQETLSEKGLTPKEYNEFIVYWMPKMRNNKYNLIHFASKAEYDDHAKLTVKPQPDSVLRVFIVYKPLEEWIAVEPQEIKSFERKGFTVVEWGGAEIK
jgi:hypothetical protein